MSDLLKKILFKKNSTTFPTKIAYCAIGFYLGYLFWYIIERLQLLNHLDITGQLFSYLISLPVSIILIIYKIIDTMFYNKNIRDILVMPIKSKNLFIIYILEITLPATKIESILFLTLSLNHTMYLSILKYYIISIASIYLISLTICILLLLLLKISNRAYIGYFFVFFQYGGFILTIFSSKDILRYLIFFQKTNTISALCSSLDSMLFLPIILTGCLIMLIITYILFQCIFLQNIYKIIDFHYLQHSSARKKIFHIHHPYLYLERKRCFENKDIIFYSILKSLVSAILIYNFIKDKYYIDENLIGLLLIFLLSAINPFSITSYSSDPFSNELTLIMPVSPYKVFQSKVCISFLLNELIIFLCTLIIFFITPSITNFLLILYGIVTNYFCSFIGVFLDYLMPKYTENKTELLHGNINKLILLFLTGIKTFVEVYTINAFFNNKHLLVIATGIDTAILLLLRYGKKLLEGHI